MAQTLWGQAPGVQSNGRRQNSSKVSGGLRKTADRLYLTNLARSLNISIGLALVVTLAALLILAQDSNQQYQQTTDDSSSSATAQTSVTILPPIQQRPNVRVNIREWTQKISEDIRLVSNRTSCTRKIEQFFERESEFQQLDLVKVRENILNQINSLLAQHRAAVNAIVAEAEKFAAGHQFSKNLRINYTDVHRLRNELELPSNSSNNNQLQDQNATPNDPFGGSNQISGFGAGGPGGQQPGVAQFTSIGGGTPVLGPPEWQTPIKSIVMQVNKNFGDIPVNTSMSAVHLPLPIYPGLPEIMNGIAWTERLDGVFKRNLAQYMHVHHQYYGDHLGFLRTFPAHRWRIPRTDPDLFDARTRPWYVAGASMPKDMVILVDTSGSMTGLRREIAKGVVFEILDTLTNNDYFSVLRFSETVTPVGLPKCNLKTPRTVPQLEEQCQMGTPTDKRELNECSNYRRQWEARGHYLRDNPNVVLGKNGSYLPDDVYRKSIFNVTQDIKDAYLLPATGRNIRYLKSNFSMPTAGIANFTHALMAAFELLQAYNRTGDQGSQCNQAIMLITDGAIRSHDDIFNRYNYPNAPVRVFTYMIGREVGDIRPTKAMACRNRGYYTHVINLSEVREQVQKYLPVMARPLVLAHHHPVTWTNAYGDETYQVLTDWVLEIKRRERARIMLNEERERLNEANSSDVINIELTNIPEYDELPLVDEELKNRIICEDATDDLAAMEQSLHDEIDPLGYNELACHWSSRRADLLTSVVKPVFDLKNMSIFFERILSKNVWTEQEIHLRNAQLLGVAAVDLRIADIIKAAPSHLLGPNGYAILIGQNGFVMHHPDLRALLEDPFDKQSKILKPYFSAVDLTHMEQVYHNESADQARRRADDMKLFKLREAAVRRGTGFESIYVKRPIDCRRRLHIRRQAFYYGPIKDTPFAFMLALPQNYGLNRLSAKLPLDSKTKSYLSPSPYDLWTIHPDYRYCEQAVGAGHQQAHQNDSLMTLVKLIEFAANGNADVLNEIEYGDLSAIIDSSSQHDRLGQDTMRNLRPGGGQSSKVERYICDKELFPSLLFDAKATYEPPDSTCGTPFYDNCDRLAFSSFRDSGRRGDQSCARTPDEMRYKLAEIYGLEMSFLATRSGLTRTRVYDLSPRIKKLAELFIQRHNRAVDEAWYARTVDWNMRFNEDATIISVPFNAYIRLVAKLRQRITQRHPAVNDTRSNCDPLLDSSESPAETSANGTTAGGDDQQAPGSVGPLGDNNNKQSTVVVDDTTTTAAPAALIQNDEPLRAPTGSLPSSDDPTATLLTGDTNSPDPNAPSAVGDTELPRINYNEYSSFDFLDLLANSSVHIAATQSVIANRRSKQRSAVAVTGHLYDYATFARRFLNSTSLTIRVLDDLSVDTGQLGLSQPSVKVDICPGGSCPTQCGMRNDTIDCLLVDNNGFIIVGEELAHVGRSLVDYDEKLVQSLVERKVLHQVDIVDYQAICARNDQVDGTKQQATGGPAAGAQASSSALRANHPLRWELAQTLVANFASALVWTVWTLYSALFLRSAGMPEDLFVGESILGQIYHWQRSAILADAQSAIANQSLLALLPNKTYLRPCEKTITLYETRPVDPVRLYSDTPEYFVTKCGCSGWYVYDSVPKTNLLMLIVNTTSACRRCDTTLSPVPGTLAPVVAPLIDTSVPTLAAPRPSGSGPNKTAEDQVCAMLERDSQLYVQKAVSSCLTSHPEEVNIHICGTASQLTPILSLLVVLSLLVTVSSLATANHLFSC